jgi:SdrD B-like domain
MLDPTNNGKIDATEVGAAGVKVTLLDANGAPVVGKTTTTDGNGYYRFDGLSAGNYKIRIDASNFAAGGPLASYGSSIPTALDPNNDVDGDDNGLTPSSPGAAKTDGIISGVVTLGGTGGVEPTNDIDVATPNPAGEAPNDHSNLTVDFGFFRTSVGNTLWYDTNNDGKIDATEPKIAGVVVELRVATSGDVIGRATTDVNGFYEITQTLDGGPLPVGVSLKVFIVAGQTPLAGLDPSGPTGLADGVNHGTTMTNGDVMAPGFTLTPGAVADGQTVDVAKGVTANPTQDFGFNAPLASLGDKVWVDTNRDGVQNEGEPGVPNMTVELRDANGTVIKTTVTDANGNYKFVDLKPGTYSVRFVPSTLPTGAQFTTQNSGTDDTLNSDADPTTGITKTYTLGKREYNPTADAGIFVATVTTTLPPTVTSTTSPTSTTAVATSTTASPTSTTGPESTTTVGPTTTVAATTTIASESTTTVAPTSTIAATTTIASQSSTTVASTSTIAATSTTVATSVSVTTPVTTSPATTAPTTTASPTTTAPTTTAPTTTVPIALIIVPPPAAPPAAPAAPAVLAATAGPAASPITTTPIQIPPATSAPTTAVKVLGVVVEAATSIPPAPKPVLSTKVSPSLSFTGADSMRIALVALSILALGFGAVWAARRRRTMQ